MGEHEQHTQLDNTPSQPSNDLVGALQVGLPLLGATLYGLGWVFFTGLSSHFGLTPEELGIDLHYLLVRLGVLLVVAMWIAAPLVIVLWHSDRFTRFRTDGPEAAMGVFYGFFFLNSALILLTALGVFIAVDAYKEWTGWIIAPTLAVAAVGLCVVHFRALISASGDANRMYVVPGLTLVLFLVLCAGGCWYFGGRLAVKAAAGNATHYRIVDFPKVRILPASDRSGAGSPDPAQNSCYVLLGTAGSSVVLTELVPEGGAPRVVRLSLDQFVLVQGDDVC